MTDDPIGADSIETARRATRTFIDAIVDGDHPAVWAMMHPDARKRAVSVALGQGLDRVKAQRFLSGNADPAELADFQRDVVGGLRRDFRSVELERLSVGAADRGEGRSERGDDDRIVTVELTSPSSLPGTDGWYAGRVRLVRLESDAAWSVVDVEPTVAGP